MGLPQLTTCCFVFDLKTGCIIMGSINAVLSFTMLTLMIVLAAEVGAIDLEVQYAGDIEMQAGMTGLYAMTIILVIMFLVKFLIDIAFVYGVSTERQGIIKAYMIMWIVFFILSMFIFFLNSPNISVGTIFTELIYIAHNVYTILLCNSFYKQLNSREEV
ncbi:uncharacterized protein LOC126055395 [Helicoverpa armigera]|uniref:uncharacterized protein LOC126055395 n=1 Tax=Helicoverpa armigera TaxID=29058 RepID=UPI000DAB30D7|nr:uncharacterized protein LOC126055395 [Helicoverpa armigera]XP_049700661.1 uncharacterized protein LOC110372118 [Helicoverpa armigera]PZC82204.1 hypothetical protein B5X24_HaOG211012 [Helicoverpa armigera]